MLVRKNVKAGSMSLSPLVARGVGRTGNYEEEVRGIRIHIQDGVRPITD